MKMIQIFTMPEGSSIFNKVRVVDWRTKSVLLLTLPSILEITDLKVHQGKEASKNLEIV